MLPQLKEDSVRFFSIIEIGNFLKHKREELDLTTLDVANSIKIRRELVEAIESGAYDKFPGRVYSIGFVRTYATYLGLDSDFIVSSLKLCPDFLMTSADHTVQESSSLDDPEKKTNVAIAVVLLCIVVFAISFFVKQRAEIIDESEKSVIVEK